MRTSSKADRHYCLRGNLSGIEHSFPIHPGDSRLGSLDSNEVILTTPGVSRLHARLHLEDGELEIEDLGSKNGTWVNSLRIRQTRISPGDEVRFGPVSLRFEESHPGDSELAISFEAGAADQTGTIPIMRSPLRGSGGTLARHWMSLAETFLARLYNAAEADLGAALSLLLEELNLQCACVLELPAEDAPIVLAASGQIGEPSTCKLRQIYASRPATAKEQDFYFHSLAIDGSPALTFGVLRVQDSDPLVLALWGSFPGRVDSEPLVRLLVRLVATCRPRPERVRGEAPTSNEYPRLVFPPGYVPAQSAAMAKIYRQMETLAQGDLPILILGETGVGKEYLAQIFHRSSPRRHGAFSAINCAAIPAELLEAELFGIGEGVATGVTASKGRLQLANGGTIFLDEIGDMSADLQAKLLRALQEKEVHPVGMDPVPLDVRVLAATNQDLTERIAKGTFRADLYYRLAGYVLDIPPLRERPQDIPALVEHFLRNCAAELKRPIRGLTVRALRLLTEYSWPGNVRELANEVRRAVYLCPANRTVESSILSKAIRELQPGNGELPVATFGRGETAEMPLPVEAEESENMPAPMGLGFDSLNLEHLENQAIEEALRRCRQNQVQASKLLGISRQKLRRRMERLGRL